MGKKEQGTSLQLRKNLAQSDLQGLYLLNSFHYHWCLSRTTKWSTQAEQALIQNADLSRFNLSTSVLKTNSNIITSLF